MTCVNTKNFEMTEKVGKDKGVSRGFISPTVHARCSPRNVDGDIWRVTDTDETARTVTKAVGGSSHALIEGGRAAH